MGSPVSMGPDSGAGYLHEGGRGPVNVALLSSLSCARVPLPGSRCSALVKQDTSKGKWGNEVPAPSV